MDPLIAATFLLLLAAATSSLASTSGPHIADLNILLPPRMSNPVHYRLRGSDGCFSWSWDHHDLLSVQPEYNDSNRCSTSARLISIAPYNNRQETAVYATDLLTGTIIRCKVLIDKISRLKIFHHAVKIDLDELATLHIRAFDNEENVFSSLVGLQFSWRLIPKTLEADRANHLIHIPLKETPLTDCSNGFCGDLDIQIELEDKGFGSDLFVVKGIGIGHEIVSAKLLEPQLEHVEDEIILTVAEAMSIEPPSPVFVTVGALIYYSLRVIHRNVPEVIKLPSPHHRWSVLNSSVAQVDSLVGTVHALHLGITSIIVEDTRVSGHVQASTLHVLLPDKLSLYLLPVTHSFDSMEGMDPVSSSFPWFVFPGQKYIIIMKVFSEGPDEKEILITENTDLKLEASIPKFWNLLSVPAEPAAKYCWRNSCLLEPYSLGEGVLTATLFYHSESKEEDEVLTVVQQVTVCGKVLFSIRDQVESLDIIHMPWAPGVYQEVQLMATGGCGKIADAYVWQSSDETVVSVSASGFIRGKRPGRAMVKVASSSDTFNYDEIAVEVSLPSSMVVLPLYPVEVEIGTQLEPAVTFKTSNGNYYYQCDAFNSFVRWNVFSESATFRIVNSTAKVCGTNMAALMESSGQFYGRPCAWTCLYASGTGRAMLQGTLSTELHSPMHSVDGPFVLHLSFPIAAYDPLVVYHAETGNKFGGYHVDLLKTNADIPHSHTTVLDDLYLVPGSSMDVMLYGGPKRWDSLVEHIDTVEVIDDQGPKTTDVQVQQAFFAGGRVYTVVCLALGNSKLLFSRGNLVGGDHPLPAIAKSEVFVRCSFPSSITLVPNEPENTLDVIEIAANADRDSSQVRSSPIVVANCGTIRIAAVGLHATKHVFANSSSLCLRWELLGCEDLAYWSETGRNKRSVENNWERFLVLENSCGLCTVRASVIGLSETIRLFEKEILQLESLKSTLVDALKLQLVSSLRVIPESVLLVFDPEAKVNLSVSGGTCFLDTFTNDTQVALISHPSENVKCSHLILTPRGLGIALVTVRDIGLSPPAIAFAMVKVANVEWIKIVCEEEISLMEGATRTFELITGTKDGYIFDSLQYAFMNIRMHYEDGILELVDINNSSSFGLAGPMFSVRAAAIGITTIYVSSSQHSGHEILSQTVTVEVYKPLQVYPDFIYLTPGASYVLVTKGGPTGGGFVEYASMDGETATVQASSGMLSAISVGNTTFCATFYGKGGNLICEAYGRVEVGIPKRMILSSQSEQLCIGCKIPIFPSFPQGSLFSFYEICNVYGWAVENEKFCNLKAQDP
ncbi:hypothetical protein AXF42_Ash012816 [Apostasia shenzhenica]|uniref:BIG2 domain-containing protein n=1 Tax=Apostasia shenzhenica TaxID=1088818 RepID=A0A2I0AMJ4_9ASPA|nr:hypothetical protein AXF42_Ash012816 [Apostasia shenzhenica]